MNALETSSVQSILYSADTATKVIETIRETLPTQKDIANMGIESVSTHMQVRFKGLPVGSIIDDVQVRYFEDTTQRFLDRFTGKMAVFGVILDAKSGQSGTRMLRRHLIDGADADGEIRFNLEVNGAYPVGTSADEYIDSINLACEAQRDVFLSLLKMSGIRPSEISEGNRLEYFQSIDSISCGIDKASQPPPKSASTTESSSAKHIAIGVVVCLGIVIATMYWIWQIHQRRKKREEEAKYREERKEERRLRRLERSKSELSTRSGNDSEIDMDSSEKERSVDGLLNKREIRRSDSTSSVSISLHSLDFENSANQSNKLDSSQEKSKLNAILKSIFSSNDPNAIGDHHVPEKKSPSQSSEVRGKGKIHCPELEQIKSTMSLQKSSSRSKSLSPYSQIRRTVRPLSMGQSQDLSIQKDGTYAHEGLQRTNQPANSSISLSKFINKEQNRQQQSSRGCVTVDMPISKVSDRISDKSTVSDKKTENKLLRYKAPPVSQHRDPNLKHQSSNRSLDGLPLRVPRTGNNSLMKNDHAPRQTRNSNRGDESFNRSLDLSDILDSHHTMKDNSGSKTNVRLAANPALHRSLDLSGFNDSRDNSKAIRGQKLNTRPAANPAFHRSLDLHDVDVSHNIRNGNRGSKTNARPAANPALHRSLDLSDAMVSYNTSKENRGSKSNVLPDTNSKVHQNVDLSGVGKTFKGTQENKTEQRNGVDLRNNLSMSDHGSVRNFRTPVVRTRSTIETNVPNNRPRPAQPGTRVTGKVQVRNRDYPIDEPKKSSMPQNIRSPAPPSDGNSKKI